MKNNITEIIGETINHMFEDKVVILEIPNTMNFWHGGNLDRYDDTLAQKKGRYEYGVGLYLTTHYGTALKYSKGEKMMVLYNMNKIVDTKVIKSTDTITNYDLNASENQ